MFQLYLYSSVFVYFFDIVCLASFFIIFFGFFYNFLYEKNLNVLSVKFLGSERTSGFNVFFNIFFFCFFFFYYIYIYLFFLKVIVLDAFFCVIVLLSVTMCLFIFVDSWFSFDKSTLHEFFIGLFIFTTYLLHVIMAFLLNFLLFYLFWLLFCSCLLLRKPRQQYMFRNKKMLPVIFVKKNK